MNTLKGQHWAVIPSRANSQRFPGKALAWWGGTTLLGHAISTCLGVREIDRVIVSSNDSAVWEKVSQDDIVHLYKRPDEYAQITTRIDDTLINMVENMEDIPEFIHLVQLTSPFI